MVNTPNATAGIRPTTAINMNRRNLMLDSPARAQAASSGKNGNKKMSQISKLPRAVTTFS